VLRVKAPLLPLSTGVRDPTLRAVCDSAARELAPATLLVGLLSILSLSADFDNFDDGTDGWTSNINELATTACAGLGSILGGAGILGQGAYVEKVFDLSTFPHAELTISMDYIKIE